MEITPPNGVEARVADVKYVIHLGGVGADYADFNSLRNKAYTYDVTINDVNDIVVEAQTDDEDRSGAEGSVVDAKSEVHTLDAHYNCFNIRFGRNDVPGVSGGNEKTGLSFMVSTPFGEDVYYNLQGYDDTSEEEADRTGDYKWIKFRRTVAPGNNYAVLAPYHPDEVMTLYGLLDDLRNWANTEARRTTFYYTAFVDEYYYEEAPNEQMRTQWTQQPLWRYFVNQEDRKVYLILGAQSSADKESSYADARYLIQQKSIQTFYSTTSFNEYGAALGMEHANETGKPTWSSTTTGGSTINTLTSGWDLGNGYKNADRYFNFDATTSHHSTGTNRNAGLNGDRNVWADFVNYTKSTENHDNGLYADTYDMEVKQAIAVCLSRNRDEDGDGQIDRSELKWYVPSRNQLTSMFLGAGSLPSPMFNDANYPLGSTVPGDGTHHITSSDYGLVWAEEGCSNGGWKGENNANVPNHVRCVRNLGMTDDESLEHATGQAYTFHRGNNVFVMSHLETRNIRTGKVTEGELAIHHNFDVLNTPYKAFQMASGFVEASTSGVLWNAFFDIDAFHNSKCKDYVDADYPNAKWRAPNQREHMLMFLEDLDYVKTPNNVGAFTRTYWKYNNARHFGFNPVNGANVLFLDAANGSYYRTIRCVRDVDVDANGNIIE